MSSLPVRAQQPAQVNADAILARVKAHVRAHTRLPYVVYTLIRRDTFDDIPDLLNSYTLRIWCRTADDAALSRRTSGSRAIGDAEFIVPAFDKPIDPGPPTADLLDVIRQSAAPAPSPTPTGLRVIGSVSIAIETAYRVTYAGVDGSDDHLALVARRDPDHNRLTDLYVDRDTAEIDRAVAHDHLYTEGRAIPERFEIDFGNADGERVITRIHGQTDYSERDPSSAPEPLHEVLYRFENIAFPAQLPDWYFEPMTYGAHRAEFPVE